MLELVMVFCLAAQPDRCIEQRQVLDETQARTECLSGAETRAIDYLRTHPGWQLARWRCERGKPHEAPA